MFTSKLVVFSALVSTVFAAGATINTPPTLTQCQPALLVWQGGVAPYFLSVIPGGNVQAGALINFGQQTGTSLTWNVNITAGTSITLSITDSTGVINYSAPLTILPGTSTSCTTNAPPLVSTLASMGSAAATAAATSTSSAVSSVSDVVNTSALSSATSVAPTSSAAAAVSVPSSTSSTASGTVPSTAASAKSTSGSTMLRVSSVLGLVGIVVLVL